MLVQFTPLSPQKIIEGKILQSFISDENICLGDKKIWSYLNKNIPGHGVEVSVLYFDARLAKRSFWSSRYIVSIYTYIE